MTREQYIRAYDRTVHRYEKLYTPRLQRALRSQIQDYIDGKDVTSEPIAAVLQPLINSAGVSWARQSNAYIKSRRKAAGQIGFNQRIVDLLRTYYGTDFLNVIENITQTTKDQIAKIVSDGQVQGLGIDEITRNLKMPELTMYRARLIARTETIAAANAAAVLNVQDLGYTFQKEWIAAHDSRTRSDHWNKDKSKSLDGQIVGLNEPFSIVDKNGITQKMMQPGDKSLGASPAQLCNCRCAVAFI